MSKSFSVRDLPPEERPRERLQKLGEQALSGQELLQLILGQGTSDESVAVTAQKLLSHFGSLEKLSEASVEEFSQIKGIGPAKAAQLKAAFEVGRRVSSHTPVYKGKELTDPEKVYKLIRSRLKDFHREHFYLITLNSRGWSVAEISIGTLDAGLVHPREVFAEAIKNKAASVIVAHNHPSDNPEPSDADIELTRRLRDAGRLMGVELLDHVIVCKNGYLSLKEKGIL